MTQKNQTVTDNPWQALRSLTDARIALGRAGVSLPTAPLLDFQLAHARARDAVHIPLDGEALAQALARALPHWHRPACLQLHSAADNRQIYLQRPDLGRRLSSASRDLLLQRAVQPCDLAVVIADGLSAPAIEQNALPFLQALARRLAPENWTLAPLAVVRQARVAIGDEIGQLLGARAVLVLIGERPGLSSPNSMGLYLSWGPQIGLLDAQRNCISNVRPGGLDHELAAGKMHTLLSRSRLLGLTGVGLKDETTDVLPEGSVGRSFLLDFDPER